MIRTGPGGSSIAFAGFVVHRHSGYISWCEAFRVLPRDNYWFQSHLESVIHTWLCYLDINVGITPLGALLQLSGLMEFTCITIVKAPFSAPDALTIALGLLLFTSLCYARNLQKSRRWYAIHFQTLEILPGYPFNLLSQDVRRGWQQACSLRAGYFTVHYFCRARKKLFLQQSLFRPKKDIRGREGQVIIEKSDKKEGGRKKVPQKSKMGIFLSFSLAWDEIAW